MAWLIPAIIALVILRLGAQLALEALNRAEARRHAGQRPAALAGVMDDATYAKSVEYTLAKSRFGSLETVYEVVVLLVLLFSGALPWLWAKFDGLAPGAAWSGSLFLVGTMILLGLPGLPLEWWSQFRLEEKFGFNKSTLKLWVTDHIKSTLLGLAIGFPADVGAAGSRGLGRAAVVGLGLCPAVRFSDADDGALPESHHAAVQQAHAPAGRRGAYPADGLGRPHGIPGQDH